MNKPLTLHAVREIDEHRFEVGAITRQLISDFDALTRQPAQQAG
jgi:hypothetical protein